jgi:hypothetical protein
MTAGEQRERTGCVLGTSFGLLALLGLIAFLVKGFLGGPVDGQARLDQLFGQQPPPFGLRLADARRLPTGDVFLRLASPEGSAPASGEPIEVVFIEYRSAAAVPPLFRVIEQEEPGGASQRLLEWEQDKSFDWSATIKKDDLVWGAWRTKFLIERSFEKGGGWQDSARVDLSQPGRALVLFALWPREVPAEEPKLIELASAVVLRPQ